MHTHITHVVGARPNFVKAAPVIRALTVLDHRQRVVALLRGAAAVATDSGGVQEETTFLRVPCLTLRPNTERPITISSGSNRLITQAELSSAVLKACAARLYQGELPPLWDGTAGPRIARGISGWLADHGC